MQIIDSFQNRLKQAMKIQNIKQVDLVERTNLDKTLINKYISGATKASQRKLTILADALNVNEVWLMGYDVPAGRNALKTDNSDLSYDSYSKINTEGLDENDIEEINRFVEFIKNKKKNESQNNSKQ